LPEHSTGIDKKSLNSGNLMKIAGKSILPNITPIYLLPE